MVEAKGILGGSGVDALGVEALVQDQTLEHALAVDEEALAIQGDLAEAEVAADLIQDLAVTLHGEG